MMQYITYRAISTFVLPVNIQITLSISNVRNNNKFIQTGSAKHLNDIGKETNMQFY